MAWYYEPHAAYTDYYHLDSWVEISSQPSSSSLSSINDEAAITTGLRVHHPRDRRRRGLRPGAPSHLNLLQRQHSRGGTSSQEEYEESESESDRVMSSSGEGLILHGNLYAPDINIAAQSSPSDAADDDDENRTAINYPTNDHTCFTPQPNAFSHPPSNVQMRSASALEPGSYFPSTRPAPRPTTRQSLPPSSHSHMPQNILSPSYNATLHHDEALRASLTTLLSCAAAARGLPKSENKRAQSNLVPPASGGSNRIEPFSLRLVPESALPVSSPDPTFKPTLRRTSVSTSASSERLKDTNKRKALVISARTSSRERRAAKKVRRSSSSEDLFITPTLMTWVVSAGVVVFLSALSFSAGYSIGKDAGRIEAEGFAGAEQLRGCAREASRSGLGLKRSLANAAVQV